MREYPDVAFQTHINENRWELDKWRDVSLGRETIWGFMRFGLAGRAAVMAHNVHPTASSLERMSASGTAIAHCPSSNAALGSGIFPSRRHFHAGVRWP